MRIFALIGFSALLLVACTTQKTLFNYKGYDEAIYDYTKNSDEKSLEQLLVVYESMMQKTGSRQVPPPGLYADYGYLLIQKGEVAKGKELLKKEIALYPEWSHFVGLILKRIE